MHRKCIIVLGMHRSGTSVCTGILSHFDAELGPDLLAPNDENPKGFFENTSVLGINKAILQSLDSDWDDYHFSLEKMSPEATISWCEKIKQVIEDQFPEGSSLIIKDPRLCLLLPLWLDVLNDLLIETRIVTTYRHPLEVAKSLTVRNNFSTQKGLLLWMHYFFELEYHSRKLPRLFLHFAKDFEDMPNLVSRLGAFSGLSISEDERLHAIDFFEPRLKHQNQPQSINTTDYPPLHATLMDLISSDVFYDNENFKKTMDTCREQYHQQLDWFNTPEVPIQICQLRALTLNHARLKKSYDSNHRKLQKTIAQHTSTQAQLIQAQSDLLRSQKELLAAQKSQARLKEQNIELNRNNSKLKRQLSTLENKSELLQENYKAMSTSEENHSEINRYYRQQLRPLEPVLSQEQSSTLRKLALAWILGSKALKALRELLTLQTRLKEIPKDDLEQANMSEYLEKNSDIRRFVESAPLQSPLWHYIMHGHKEIQQHQRKPLSKSLLKHHKQQ